jgi:wyosine [tRNA(Phe)-imidazoG37] synthetase (radical SAM superfamily)
MQEKTRRVYGPVPSRRLGKSLGVNNIPFKICTYSCIYCQLGRAVKVQAKRQEFYGPAELLEEAKRILSSIHHEEEYPDYITIVPDGEPTLDSNLDILIRKLQTLEIPVAVISNASLTHLPEVRNALLHADYVSLKIDTVNEETWRKINKPHRSLRLDEIISGIRSFADKYHGKLVTETMLLQGFNDSQKELEEIARFIESFRTDTVYLAIPTRPPAYREAIPADESALNRAYHIFREHSGHVELLTGYEGNAFSSTGNFREDLLSITAVHPMREDAVLGLLDKTNGNDDLLEGLIEENLIQKTYYGGYTYYLRKFRK